MICLSFENTKETFAIAEASFDKRDRGPAFNNEFIRPTLPVIRLLSIKNLFSSEWFKLQMASNSQTTSLKLDLTADKFPYLLRNKTLKVSKAEVLFIPSDLSKAGKLGTFSVSRLGFDGLQVIENPATVAHPKIAQCFYDRINIT